MPPPKEMPNILRGPGDYEVTTNLHNDTYPSISPLSHSLPNLTVFITGGSRGLGRATALSFARAGASHIAVGARSPLTDLATDIQSAASCAGRPEPRFLALEMDVTSESSVADAAAKVEREWGRLHVLVNNAGVLGPYGLIADSDPEEWWRVMAVNLRGPYLVTRAFLPLLVRSAGGGGGGDGGVIGCGGESGSGGEGRGGYIINVTSVGAHLANPTLSAYQISKNALLKLSTLTDAEYAEKGIVTVAIHPGNVATDIMGGPEAIPEHHKHVFVETPELSADSIVYLVSERRDWLAGRYVNCTWDLPELMSKEEEIVKGDRLKTKFVW